MICMRIRLRNAFVRFCSSSISEPSVSLSKHLQIPIAKAQHILLKNPKLAKLNEDRIVAVVDAVQKLGFSKQSLVEVPGLFSQYPITIVERYQVLDECGLKFINLKDIYGYMRIVRSKTVLDLKSNGKVDNDISIDYKISSYLSQWPKSLNHDQRLDEGMHNLNDIRNYILCRYLELILDLSQEEFKAKMKIYQRTRSFRTIDKLLNILLFNLNFTTEKIKSNLFLLFADLENVKNLLNKFKKLAGIDIKEVLRICPRIFLRNYKSIIEIENILLEHGFNNEVQSRCIEIFTLSPETVRSRIEAAMKIPDFKALYDHQRFIKLIMSKNKAVERMETLHKHNKKCISLDIFTASASHYRLYAKKPGDSTKGKDLIAGLAKDFGNEYSRKELHNALKKHPFWLNVPLVNAKLVLQELSLKFTMAEIFDNIQILLYDVDKINRILMMLSSDRLHSYYLEQYDHSQLNNSQLLSLVLYFLEKDHHFSGSGIWTQSKVKSYENDYVTKR